MRILLLINDFVRNIFWAVGGILTIYTSIASMQSPNIEVGGLNLWGWVVIAIVLAIILTLNGHFLLQGKFPKIKVVIQHNDFTNKLYADVKNDGAEGIFEAQIRIIEATDIILETNQGIYRGYWEESQKGTVKIPYQGTKRLLIAEFYKGSYSGSLRIFGEDFGGFHQLNHSYPLLNKDNDIVIPEVSLVLTISSSPNPLKGSKVIGLRIWANNRYEVDYAMNKKKLTKLIDKGLSKIQFHRILDKASQPVKKSEKGKS